MNKACFIIMPFDSRFNGIWESVIQLTIKNMGDNAIRVDNIFTTGSILSDIINNIAKSDYVVADLTLQNPNVYYELGYSHALNKKVILLTQDINSLPFDLRHQRVISYSDTAAGAVKLKNDLEIFINNL